MKALGSHRRRILAAAFVLALIGGCQSSPFKKDGLSRREAAEFQKKVASDPFPVAQQASLPGL